MVEDNNQIANIIEGLRQMYHKNFSNVRHVGSNSQPLDYPEDEQYATHLSYGSEEEDDSFLNHISGIEAATNKDEVYEAVKGAKDLIRGYELDLTLREAIIDDLSLLEKISIE